MSPELWQGFLAAELSTTKGRALLKELGPCRDSHLDRLLNHPLLTASERERVRKVDLDRARRAFGEGKQIVSLSEYPETLRSWPENPIGLFVEGDWRAVHNPSVGIVGTRSASTYGKAVASKFAEALARSGVTVVSGGALGIDAAAHKGALEAQGKTVAVLAGGLDQLYPALHRGLFRQIVASSGCLVSQFAIGARAVQHAFLIRNQLIAGLSQAILVIEAPERSGALSTAARANEMGRHVFVAPANIDNVNFRGSHALIRDGATLVDHPDQILAALGIEAVHPISTFQNDSAAVEIILSSLTVNPMPVEKLLDKTSLEMPDLMTELTMLELDGRIIRDAGGYARKP